MPFPQQHLESSPIRFREVTCRIDPQGLASMQKMHDKSCPLLRLHPRDLRRNTSLNLLDRRIPLWRIRKQRPHETDKFFRCEIHQSACIEKIRDIDEVCSLSGERDS